MTRFGSLVRGSIADFRSGLSREQIVASFPTVYASSAHASRSERYLFIPTGDILDALRDTGLTPTFIMAAHVKSPDKLGFEKHLIRLRPTGQVGSSDPDVREVILINSHDGMSSYKLMAGIFRLVCANGCIMGDVDDTATVRHTGRTLDNVVAATHRIVDGSIRIMEEVEEMKALPMPRDAQLLLSEAAMSMRWKGNEAGRKNMEVFQPADFLRPRRYADAMNREGVRDLYTTYQVLQENHIRGGVRRNGHTTRSIQAIDETVRVNTLLWEAARQIKDLVK